MKTNKKNVKKMLINTMKKINREAQLLSGANLTTRVDNKTKKGFDKNRDRKNYKLDY